MCAKQADQKEKHDRHLLREYFVGQRVWAQNVKGNPDWIQSVVVERSGPVWYVVEVILNGIHVLWTRHVDQIKTWDALDEKWPDVTTPVDVGKEVLVPETDARRESKRSGRCWEKSFLTWNGRRGF